MSTPIVVHSPSRTASAIGHTVSAPIDLVGTQSTLSFSMTGAVPEPRIDAVIPAVLLAAMVLGAPILCEGQASGRLLDQIQTIEEVYATWSPRLKRIPISAEREVLGGPHGPGVASFFTGGLDSYYTLLTHLEEIDSIVFVHGFASPISGEGRLRASETLHRISKEFDKSLIEVETNLAVLLDEWLNPRERGPLAQGLTNFELAHGAALASVGHLLPDRIGRVYIAATYTYDQLFPWGSHPLLDPLWSTQRVEFVHDGAGATRVRKARLVGRSALALATLRVCPNGTTSTGRNCGRCEKCLRTMINLRIAGVLDQCSTFAEPLDLKRVALMGSPDLKPFLRENLAAALALGSDPELIDALKRAVHPWRPGRIALELGLSGWKAMKRVLPVEYSGGRIRWR